MYGLSICLQSFYINHDLIDQNNNIRVSITTFPDDTKQAFIIKASQTNNINRVFTANITKKTKKIIFVFRKVSITHNDPIIASTIVHSNEFPKPNNLNNTEIKRIHLLEPLYKFKEMCGEKSNKKRLILGEMWIQMTPADPFPVPLFDEGFKSSNNNNGFEISLHHKKPVQVDENQNVVFNKNWVYN